MPGAPIVTLAAVGTNVFAGTGVKVLDVGEGVYLSSNNGTSWTAVSNGLTNTYVDAFAVNESNFFAGTAGGGVFLTINNGTNWTAANTDLTNPSVLALVVSGTNLFAGTGGSGVFLSTNNGTSWSAANTGLPNGVGALAVSGTNLFAGIFDLNLAGVYLSTDSGASWTGVNSGLPLSPARSISSFAVIGTNLFAGIGGGGVWRRPLSEMVTSVQNFPTDLPKHFSLGQNYPNPFNPATVISFGLPSKSFVSLKVFDALGREVSIVLSEDLSAGTYSRQWNAGGLPSGVYFYRLQAGPFIETKKLVLLR